MAKLKVEIPLNQQDIATVVAKKSTKLIMSELKKTRKIFIEQGMTSTLPSTLKEYTAQYEGTKANARYDYAFEMTREMETWYNKQAKKSQKVQAKLKEMGYDINPKPKFAIHANNTLVNTIRSLGSNIKTIQNMNNPNYLKTDMPKQQQKKLVQNTENTPEGKIVTSAGIPKANYKTFGGRMIALAYNNFLIALSHLGYTKTINQVLKLTPGEWEEIFIDHKDSLDLVYKYSEVSISGDDDLYCEWFGGEPADNSGIGRIIEEGDYYDPFY